MKGTTCRQTMSSKLQRQMTVKLCLRPGWGPCWMTRCRMMSLQSHRQGSIAAATSNRDCRSFPCLVNRPLCRRHSCMRTTSLTNELGRRNFNRSRGRSTNTNTSHNQHLNRHPLRGSLRHQSDRLLRCHNLLHRSLCLQHSLIRPSHLAALRPVTPFPYRGLPRRANLRSSLYLSRHRLRRCRGPRFRMAS